MLVDIELDDALLAEAMEITGLPTEQAAVEEALRRLVRARRQLEAIKEMRGMGWDGDLDEMRRSRKFDLGA